MENRGIKQGRWLIGDLVFDPGKRQIARDSRPVTMPKLSYRLFAALAESAPNVVTHEELVDRVWRGRAVSHDTIMQRVKLLREALGDDANAPRYVALVRGEGYRLLEEVEALPAEADNLTRGLVAELGRRRVLQVALVYAAVAWSITEVASFLIEALPVFPAGSKALVAIVFVVGFPVAIFLAWRFDIGPGGIQRTQGTSAADRASIAAAVLLLATWYGMSRTKLGLYMRATQQDLEIAQAFGVPVRRVYATVFALGAMLAAVAGVLIVPVQQAHYLMGLDPLLLSFIVVIIGGLGSLKGTVVAAFVIGLGDGVVSVFFSPTLAKILATLLVALVLVYRPSGLFGDNRA